MTGGQIFVTGGTENNKTAISQLWPMGSLWTFGMFQPSLVRIITGMNCLNHTVLYDPFFVILHFVTGGHQVDGKQYK